MIKRLWKWLTEGIYGTARVMNHSGGGGILYFHKVLSLTEVNISICEQKKPHTDLTKDWNNNPAPWDRQAPLHLQQLTTNTTMHIILTWVLYYKTL
jgi:hypothetical protein